MILGGLGWGYLQSTKPTWAFLVPTLLGLQVVWTFIFPFSPLDRFYHPDLAFTKLPTSEDNQACMMLNTFVRDAQGQVLGEEVGILVENNKEAIGSAWMFNALRGKGLIDLGIRRLEESVRRKEFDLILLDNLSYPSDFVSTGRLHYESVENVKCFFTWEIFTPPVPK